MMSKIFLRMLGRTFAVLMPAVIIFACSPDSENNSETVSLHDGWKVQQSDTLGQITGSGLSSGSVSTSTWYPATVPSTIMGVLTSNGLYSNAFMADSIKNLDKSQFDRSWWYFNEFKIQDLSEQQKVMLCFDGISYYANIWLNGKQVATREEAYGTFRRFAFDVSSLAKEGPNILAVEIFKQKPGDLGHGFVDWNPAPPDNNMGLWREVYVKITGEAALKNIFIQSDVDTETLAEATLTVEAEVVNYSGKSLRGNLVGEGDGIKFSVPVKLEPGETRKVKVTPDEDPSLQISQPRLWWCHNMGDPNLYHIKVTFESKGKISDSKDITFGIREIESYYNAEGHRGYRLNGKDILIRGAGWTDDIFFRDTEESNEIQVQYVKHMNLNTIRFENIWGKTPNIYDLCDKYGLLAMVGWSCQWEWDNYLGKECDEFGGIKSQPDMDLAVRYLNDQIQYLQNHPSIFVWMLGSDMIPRPALENRYKQLIDSIDNRPYLAAASWRKSSVSGNTGVKMKGPYNYVGPTYWYIDSVNGGAYGFNTETGPGPQIPVLETINRMIPPDKLWPINNIWNYHCNPSESFGDLSIFNNVLYKRYGQPTGLPDYLAKAGLQQYEALKAMFEAFRANRPNSTGVIQWMLNSAWPSFYWQLYDYYLLPTSAYYAARKANAPVQLIYNYGNRKIYTVNETLNPLEKTRSRIEMTDSQGKVIFSEEIVSDIAQNESKPVFELPSFQGICFLSLTLFDKNNEMVADNFYWLSDKPDVYDWKNTEWYYTPMTASSDFRALSRLPAVDIEITPKTKEHLLEVAVHNKSDRTGFFINLTLKGTDGHTLFPVFWDDNYVSILPGQTKTLQCSVPDTLNVAEGLTLTVSGMNIKEQSLKVAL